MLTYDVYGKDDALSIELSDYPDKVKVCYRYEMVIYFNESSGYKGRLSEEYDYTLKTDKLITLEDLEISDDGKHIFVYYQGKDIRF